MATAGDDVSEILIKEFESWLETAPKDGIFLLDTLKECSTVIMNLLLESEYEFKLHCPTGYPEYEDHFYVEADPAIKIWCNALNEFLIDSPQKLRLPQVLDKAVALYTPEGRDDHALESEEEEVHNEEEESVMEEEEDMGGGFVLSDDDTAFTTQWELQVARKKKRWAQKEEALRKDLKEKAKLGPSTSDVNSYQANDKEHAQQIFTSSAASGILTNDLVKLMDQEKNFGFSADPIDDNIYQWCVKLYDFEQDSDLAKDLAEVDKLFGYNYIELQLDFAIDFYPFYPPLVKVVRPRLQGSMMQRVTNMEMLKLSYWNPAKDMESVLCDIKQFLQQWARLEVASERNDRKRFTMGSYVDIEHHLLRLALVSEVNPRANIKYHQDLEKPADRKAALTGKGRKKRDEYWAAGVGYGHHNRPEWDIKAYLAAQKEKDKQIESVLHKILKELKKLYANHAPQLKPRMKGPVESAVAMATGGASNTEDSMESESIDPVEDVYNILEGSGLVPFIEQYLRADSFLEICRHTSVYKVIVDIIKEIALQNQLVPLLGALADQEQSVYQLLEALEQKASMLLQHICKAGNGSIPKPPKKEAPAASAGGSSKKQKDSCLPLECLPEVSSASVDLHPLVQPTAEEKLAREFQVVFRDVQVAFSRACLDPSQRPEVSTPSKDSEVMDITVTPEEQTIPVDVLYKQVLVEMQFLSCEIEVDGATNHHFAKEFKKQETLSQTQVFRIAQELTSLSTSLPLDLSSSIFVRTDDDRLTLMRALITGPEGTPYSFGCYLFDIFFPSMYPKVPPMVNLQTTGGGTVRFNPNLYNCGKVCLSLLGTWEGQQGEQWNETTSTVLQVLVSIQSLILVPEPYFNEPGYEQEIGTDTGKRHSAEYNLDVKINNIKHAMIAPMQNPCPGFEDVIKAHFYLRRDLIIQEVESWMRTSKSSRLERSVQNLKQELLKLQPPPNLANLSRDCRGSPRLCVSIEETNQSSDI